jgi:hypothetical protein
MLVLVATLTRGFRARAVVLGPHIVNHRAPAPSLAAAAHLSTKAGACEISPASHGTEPLDNFEDIGGLDVRLVRALRDANYRTPTTIQAHAMPLLVRGDDVMASAQTGSGKTLCVNRILTRAPYLPCSSLEPQSMPRVKAARC